MRDDRYLTARDVAELLQLNVETIYQLINTDQLPAVRIGRRWRLNASELHQWLKTHCLVAERRQLQ